MRKLRTVFEEEGFTPPVYNVGLYGLRFAGHIWEVMLKSSVRVSNMSVDNLTKSTGSSRVLMASCSFMILPTASAVFCLRGSPRERASTKALILPATATRKLPRIAVIRCGSRGSEGLTARTWREFSVQGTNLSVLFDLVSREVCLLFKGLGLAMCLNGVVQGDGHKKTNKGYLHPSGSIHAEIVSPTVALGKASNG